MRRFSIAMALLLFIALALPLCADVAPSSPSDLVTLVGGFNTTPPPGCGPYVNAFPIRNRVSGDGSLSLTPFTIPANQVLVLTGIDYAIDSTGALAGGPDTVFLHITSPTATAGSVVFTSVAAPGRAGATAPLSGIAVAAGSTLCFSKSGPWTAGTVFVHGFVQPTHP